MAAPPNPNDSKYQTGGGTSTKSTKTKALGVPGTMDSQTGYSGYTAQGPEGTFYTPGNPEQPLNFGFGNVTAANVRNAQQHGVPVGQSLTAGIVPRYFSGDEYQIGSMAPDQLMQIQMALKQAGFYPANTEFTAGVPDEQTIAAYKKALSLANVQGQSVYDTLASGVKLANQKKPAKAPLTIRLTDPADITAALQKTARTLMGGNLAPDQVNTFVQNYQAAEAKSQTDFYNAQNSGVGGTYAQNPATGQAKDLTTEATNYIDTTFPGQVAGTGVGENFSKFQQMLTQSLPGGLSQAQH